MNNNTDIEINDENQPRPKKTDKHKKKKKSGVAVLKKQLTVLLVVIIGVAAAVGGISLAKWMNSPLDDESSVTAVQELEPIVLGSKYNVLLMGTDAEGGLTDVMMIYQIDPQRKSVNVLSIPRDTQILFNGRIEKINAAHSYGKQQVLEDSSNRGDEYAIRAIRELTGIPIHHYVCINFAAFRQVIDALDGFDFYVPQDMDYDDDWQDLHIHLKEGMQHLDGDKGEQLVRFRRYRNGDIDRIKVQQDVLKALIEQKVTPAYISKVPKIFDIVLDNIDTDMTPADAYGVAMQILDARDSVETFTVPGVPRDGADGLSYWIADMDALDAIVAENFGYGGDNYAVDTPANADGDVADTE